MVSTTVDLYHKLVQGPGRVVQARSSVFCVVEQQTTSAAPPSRIIMDGQAFRRHKSLRPQRARYGRACRAQREAAGGCQGNGYAARTGGPALLATNL